MISVQMVGEFSYSDFASSRREAHLMIESAKEFLRRKGCQIIKEADEWVGWSRSGESTRILIGKTTPNGVR